MKLESNKYAVNIIVDTTFTIDSNDNMHYDVILNPHNITRYDYYTTFSISINNTYKIALISYYFASCHQCAVLEDDILVILCANHINKVNLMTNELISSQLLNTYPTTFGIYKVSYGYVIYGEMEIIMLDNDLREVWSFSGADIFVSIIQKEPFKISNDKICVYDFTNNYYEVDFDGKLIYSKMV